MKKRCKSIVAKEKHVSPETVYIELLSDKNMGNNLDFVTFNEDTQKIDITLWGENSEGGENILREVKNLQMAQQKAQMLAQDYLLWRIMGRK